MPTFPHVVSTVVLAAHWTIVLAISLRVVARRLSVGASLAWIAVVLALPFLGAAAYLVFGGKRLGRAHEKRHAAAEERAAADRTASLKSPWAGAPPPGSVGEALYQQAVGLMGLPAQHGNRTHVLTGYESVFAAWIADIDRASVSCRLAFYIWHEGGLAGDLADALSRASARGVRCRVLVDAIGSKEFLRGRRIRDLREAGVEVAAALPRSFGRRADLRNHRKIMVIDGRVGYTGSQNLVDPRYFKQDSGVGQWVDAVVRVEGPAVERLAAIFEVDWSVETATDYVAPEPWAGAKTEVASGALMHVVPSGPAPHPDAIRQLILTAVYSARRTLTVTTPYFVPDEATLTALVSAARRGVGVTLIVPARNDSVLVRYASSAQYGDLLEAGARIALFNGGLLHTKSMVVDDALCLFGSVNLDMRSFWLNFEISLFVYDTAFAKRIAELQQAYLTQCDFVVAEDWQLRPAWRRFPENAARLVGPIL